MFGGCLAGRDGLKGREKDESKFAVQRFGRGIRRTRIFRNVPQNLEEESIGHIPCWICKLFGIFSIQFLQKDSPELHQNTPFPPVHLALAQSLPSHCVSPGSAQCANGGCGCHGFAEPAPRDPGPGALEGAEYVLPDPIFSLLGRVGLLPSGAPRFFDEVWGLSFLGLSEKIQDEGSLFWTIASQILCTIAMRCLSPLCAVFREGGLTQTNSGTSLFGSNAGLQQSMSTEISVLQRIDALPQPIRTPSQFLAGATAAMSSAGPAHFCRAGAGRSPGPAWRTPWRGMRIAECEMTRKCLFPQREATREWMFHSSRLPLG